MDLMTSRKNHPEDTLIHVRNITIGGEKPVIIAGPCTIESRSMMMEIAKSVKDAGANMLRGGAFKPRTSPYTFQGIGADGLNYLSDAGEQLAMPTVSEIMSAEDIPLFENIDVLQVGAKNMQNYPLLRALGKTKKAILLKRGYCNTLDELLFSAEYILNAGNPNVILCERGIRTFEHATRYTFDINAIPLLKQLTHLPVIADPSHGTGMSSIVCPVAMAAIAAGCNGLLIEVHKHPEEALCDGRQALTSDELKSLVLGVKTYETVCRSNKASV